ncbi:MAG TPA: YceI family protein [Chryseolinea sp.]|nr:YceI family protein [Chryseolinea sp.]
MTQRIPVIILLVSVASTVCGQKYVSDKTFISFYSHAAIEDIKAENKKTTALFDAGSGDIAFSVPIKEFQFAKSLMKEHFNEKYMDTEKFPKSTFQGVVEGFDPASKTEQSVIAKGKLSIHGVTKDVEIPGKLTSDGSTLVMKASFITQLKDYNIEIPTLMWQNIAEQVEVTVDFSFKPQ